MVRTDIACAPESLSKGNDYFYVQYSYKGIYFSTLQLIVQGGWRNLLKQHERIRTFSLKIFSKKLQKNWHLNMLVILKFIRSITFYVFGYSMFFNS